MELANCSSDYMIELLNGFFELLFDRQRIYKTKQAIWIEMFAQKKKTTKCDANCGIL